MTNEAKARHTPAIVAEPIVDRSRVVLRGDVDEATVDPDHELDEVAIVDVRRLSLSLLSLNN